MQPSNTTTIANCTMESSGQQAVCYIGSDQRLYLLVQDGVPGDPYHTIDLISRYQSEMNFTPPFPRPGVGPRSNGPMAMNWLGVKQTGAFLFYIDQNNHVEVLTYPIDHVYTDQAGLAPDLSEDTGAPPAATGSSIACYGSHSEPSQHVVYVGEDGNVWELSWTVGQENDEHNGPLWLSRNLSVTTGYTGVLAPKRFGPLAATMFEAEHSANVVYVAGDNSIRQLYFEANTGWRGSNLTATTSATAPAANTPLVTFACTYEDTLHVIYLGVDGAVHELWWGNGFWHHDHTISQISTKPASDTALAGYVCEFEKSHHVIYCDIDNDIQELYRKGGAWNNTTLSLSAGSGATPLLNTASPLGGNSHEATPTQQVVFYLDKQTRLHELYRHHDEWFAGMTAG